jgi:cytoskeletal protein RodZ
MAEEKQEFRSEKTQREERRLRIPLLIVAIVVGAAIFAGIALWYVTMVDRPPPPLP